MVSHPLMRLPHRVTAAHLSAGPVTILNWSFPRKDVARSVQAFQLALALRDEVADLEAAGCKIIQVPDSSGQVVWYGHVSSLNM